MGTFESLEAWLEFIQEVSAHWGDLMETEWLDLPPDVADTLMVASRAFADAGELLNAAMQGVQLA